MSKHVVILCIINNGYSEVAMDAAKHCGARGGTVLHGRGTVSKEAEKFFNITVTPEKEIVMILVSTDIKDAILKALYDAVYDKIREKESPYHFAFEQMLNSNIQESFGEAVNQLRAEEEGL